METERRGGIAKSKPALELTVHLKLFHVGQFHTGFIPLSIPYGLYGGEEIYAKKAASLPHPAIAIFLAEFCPQDYIPTFPYMRAFRASSPQQVDHVPGEHLGAGGAGGAAARGHEERAEGRVAPQLEARVAEVAEVSVGGAGEVEGADEATVR